LPEKSQGGFALFVQLEVAKLTMSTHLCIAFFVFSPMALHMLALAEEVRIPMNVYVTSPHDVMPPDMQELWANNTLFLDGAEVHHYSESAMTAAVKEMSDLLRKEIGIRGAYKAFRNLRPGAFRADLWRMMMLWAKGGIYLDIDLELQAPITTWLQRSNSTLYLVRDQQDTSQEAFKAKEGLAWAYWNAMMAATPRNEFLEHAIRTIVGRLNRHYYAQDQKADHSLAITGPRALGMALETYTGSIETLSQAAQLKVLKHSDGNDEVLVKLDNETIVKHSERLEKGNIQKSAHYGELYWMHLIYCDEGYLPCTPATQHFLATGREKFDDKNPFRLGIFLACVFLMCLILSMELLVPFWFLKKSLASDKAERRCSKCSLFSMRCAGKAFQAFPFRRSLQKVQDLKQGYRDAKLGQQAPPLLLSLRIRHSTETCSQKHKEASPLLLV